MKLLYASASPFVRTVMLVLHETDQLSDVALENVATSPLKTDPKIPSENPLGKIPTLFDTEFGALYDSRVITRYLDDRAQAGLYGTGSMLWTYLRLEATAAGIMDALVFMTYEKRLRPEAQWSHDLLDAQWTKVTRSLNTLNSDWAPKIDPQAAPKIDQMAIASALGYADLRHEDRNWRADCDALAKWFDSFEQRPSMQATHP
ncbi:MAG: glutathione S-transferase family protein [Halocynthiibacter sp.]